jgi:hypothetical protein
MYAPPPAAISWAELRFPAIANCSEVRVTPAWVKVGSSVKKPFRGHAGRQPVDFLRVSHNLPTLFANDFIAFFAADV